MKTAIGSARSFDYDIWDLYGETKGNTELFPAPDGLHFNDRGHAFFMAKVKAWHQKAIDLLPDLSRTGGCPQNR